jgi:large subunit ribosomal protein L21
MVKAMYAVIRTGGKQYRVAKDDVITIERLGKGAGESVTFGDVLLVGGAGSTKIGAPLVTGAQVAGEVLAEIQGPKVLVIKKKRRHNYRRKNGHRQALVQVKITDILAG